MHSMPLGHLWPWQFPSTHTLANWTHIASTVPLRGAGHDPPLFESQNVVQ